MQFRIPPDAKQKKSAQQINLSWLWSLATSKKLQKSKMYKETVCKTQNNTIWTNYFSGIFYINNKNYFWKTTIYSLQPMASDYNSTLEVVCIPGYILPNGRRNQLLRCDSNTQWRNADNPLRNNNILRRVSFL